MTWAEFKNLVRVYMPVHGRRQGVQVLIDQYIKAAIIDLQEAIVPLQQSTTRVYAASRFSTDGHTGKAHYPTGVVLVDAYTRDPDDQTVRFDYRTASSPGERYDMIEGLTRDGERWLSIDAPRGLFRVTPNPLEDGSEVVLVWSGIHHDFEETDDVPFGEREAEAASEFVLSRVTRQVDKDLALSESHANSYKRLKRLQYVRHLEVARLDGRIK